MWKERHGYYWAQTWLGATNATEGHPLGLTGQWVEDDQFNQDWRGFDSDPAGWASEEYQNCLDACETTCDELAETNPGEPGEFERLYDSAFLQREGYERSIADSGYETEFGIDDIGKHYYPTFCFEDVHHWTFWGWVTWRVILFWCGLIPSFLIGFVLACCQSHRCCPWFKPLNRLRHTGAQDFPRTYSFIYNYVLPCCCAGAACAGQSQNCCSSSGEKVAVVAPEDGQQVSTCEPGVEMVEHSVVTTQPGSQDAAPGVARSAGTSTAAPTVRQRSSVAQLRLLVWKAWREKTRDLSTVLKQVFVPALWFVLIWLVYVMTALTGQNPQAKWSPKNMNYKRREDNPPHGYKRGDILSHGTLETYFADRV